MRTTTAGVTVAAALFSTLALAPPASADGCAQLGHQYRVNNPAANWAVVHNTCGHTIRARAVVDRFPDSSCRSIAPHSQVDVRVSGWMGPSANSATEC